MLSVNHGPPRRDTADLGEPVAGPVWLEPWPDEVANLSSGSDPAASYQRRESVELAFVAALQHLPGTHRAVLILREVLEFSAAEVARILDATPASVNSALQRARKAVDQRIPPVGQQAELDGLGTDGRRELVDAFVAAWGRADVPALLDLLAEDARFTMPPLHAWFLGREDIGRFLAERMFASRWRLCRSERTDSWHSPATRALRTATGSGSGRSTRCAFVPDGSWRSPGSLDPDLHRHFGLPEELPDTL